jgi:hypothetical protein
MKYLFSILVLLFIATSCEDVVDVDLNNEAPRLIVDALIRIDTAQNLTDATIKVSLSSSFFGAIEPASIENLELRKEDDGSTVPYEPIPGSPGLYRPFSTTTSPVSDNKIVTNWLIDDSEFLLYVTYQDQLYLARTSFAPSSPIDSVTQGDGGLFDEDDKEVIVAFTDIEAQENYYLFDFGFNEFLPTEDRFYEGQQFEFSYFYDAEDTGIATGDEVNISILGATEDFFNYMNGLVEQSQQGDNGPFQTPTATVRGNFLNVTDIDNIDQFDNVNRPDAFILGYFSLSQEFTTSFVIEE